MEAEPSEQADLMVLVREVKAILDTRYTPDGYNVGFNSGAAAGGPVDHLHIHVIPRYRDDVADPRGGIRHVIPGIGNYLQSTYPQPSPDSGADRLLDASREHGRLRPHLVECFSSERFDRIDLAASFIMRSGPGLILGRIDTAAARGATVRILTTDYGRITDPDALADLLDLADSPTAGGGGLEVKVWQSAHSFHPKAYLFWSTGGREGSGFVGSSNLSRAETDAGWSGTSASATSKISRGLLTVGGTTPGRSIWPTVSSGTTGGPDGSPNSGRRHSSPSPRRSTPHGSPSGRPPSRARRWRRWKPHTTTGTLRPWW